MVPKGPTVQHKAADNLPAYARDMPDWWQPRDSQIDATEKIAGEYEAGARVVLLDAPTGTGKTAMAELLRRRLSVERGLYVCTTKSLQEQIARDFTNARVLKGRKNYLPNGLMSRQGTGYRQEVNGARGLGISCADCDRGPRDCPIEEQTCSYCPDVGDCPYLSARYQAMVAPVGVLNTSFLLTHANGGGAARSPFVGRELVVADECDLLEDELLGYVEFRLNPTMAQLLGVDVPKKGSHMTTIRAWLEDEVLAAVKVARAKIQGQSLEARRNRNRLDQLTQDARRVVDREEGWVRDGDEERGGNGLVLKPVSVEDVGERYLWRHAERWLAMSGTVVSAETMAESLGLEEAGIEWASVKLDMPFEVSKRPVRYVPVATMTRKGQEAGALQDVLLAVDKILAKHPGVNVLVHTHTYRLASDISQHIRLGDDPRSVVTYREGAGRDSALAAFKAGTRVGGAVMVAPSMDRGIDLPGDECRVQIIVKVPMASLGSRQVSERLRTPGGNSWYLAQTCRTILQMSGRGVRSMEDECTTYILDKHFSKILKDGKRMGMFPQWWLDALSLGRLS